MSDEDENAEFRINKDYAEKYNKWRRGEELQKLKDKYGDVGEGDETSDSSSSSESEDEDANALTPELEKDWFKAFAAVKTRNPKIYDGQTTFFHDKPGSRNKTEKKSSSKEDKQPMFLKDYERKVILERDGILSDDESSEDDNVDTKPGYYEEQQEILKSLKEAVGSSDEDEGNFLTQRKKSKEELQKEEEEYVEWLKGQKDDLETDEQVGEDLVSLKEYWSDPKLSSDEKFLRDFILNKRYLEEDEGLPTYDQIVEDLSEEEEQLQKEENFEHKYNFRFEDPDQDFIKSYPRTTDESVRKKDTKRAEKRRLQKEKKEKEKAKVKEEIKQLKNLKKREIADKIEALKEVTGNPELGLSVNDLEGDFDPEAYDKMMKKAFNKQYYDADMDDEKPTWSDDEELGLQAEDWDNWTGEADTAEAGEDYEEEEYTNYLPSCEEPQLDTGQEYPTGGEMVSSKKKKKRGPFQKVVETKKPVFEPGEKTFEEYLDEYYKLDYEDIIGDMPCRFKYRQTVANDFGLTTDEVLSAREKELNQWVSVKRMSQYRTQEEEKFDVKKFSKKGRDIQKKLNVLTSLKEKETPGGHGNNPLNDGESNKVKKKRKKRKFEGDSAKIGNLQSQTEKTDDEVMEIESSAKRRKVDSNKSKPGSESTREKKKFKEKPEETGNIKDKGFQAKIQNLDGMAVTSKEDKRKLKSKKKKQKLKMKKLKGHQPKVGTMSDERLKAYGINPKKFKYRFMSKRKS